MGPVAPFVPLIAAVAGPLLASALGGKGTTQSRQVELDPAMKKAALDMMGLSNEVRSIPYTPYEGATVAGFSPMQVQAMQGANNSAAAFNMPHTKYNPKKMSTQEIASKLTGMPMAEDMGGGYYGYSSMPAYEQAKSQMPEGVVNMIDSFFAQPKADGTLGIPKNPNIAVPDSIKTGMRGTEGMKKKKAAAAKKKAANKRTQQIRAGASGPGAPTGHFQGYSPGYGTGR